MKKVFICLIFLGFHCSYAQSLTRVGDAGFSTYPIRYGDIAMSPSGYLYVVYSLFIGTNAPAYVAKYNGTSWTNVGGVYLSSGTADYTSMDFDSSGNVYVAFQDFANGEKATVKKYDGNSWQTVGSAGFTEGKALFTKIVVNKNGVPYLIYTDDADSNKAVVVKFNGTSWEKVGGTAATKSKVYFPDIAIASDNTIYISYMITGPYERIVTEKFNGTSWEMMGGEILGEYPSLAIDQVSNMPYVAYSQNTSYKYCVGAAKYDGTSWSLFGDTTTLFGSVHSLNIKIDKLSGAVYISHSNTSDSGIKSSISAYNGQSWSFFNVGDIGYLGPGTEQTAITTDDYGFSYVIFCDGNKNSAASVFSYRPSSFSSTVQPAILIQPQSKPACIGKPAYLFVAANNATKYQWQKDGINIPGATTAGYNIPSVSTSSSGSYSVIVSNNVGSVTSNAVSIDSPGVHLDLSPFDYICTTITSIILSGGSPMGGSYWYKNNPVTAINTTASGIYKISYVYNDVHACGLFSNSQFIVRECKDHIAGINDVKSIDPEMLIYPNPNEGSFIIRSEYSDLPYAITSPEGKKLVEGLLDKDENSITIPLAAGIYILKIGKNTRKLIIY